MLHSLYEIPISELFFIYRFFFCLGRLFLTVCVSFGFVLFDCKFVRLRPLLWRHFRIENARRAANNKTIFKMSKTYLWLMYDLSVVSSPVCAHVHCMHRLNLTKFLFFCSKPFSSAVLFFFFAFRFSVCFCACYGFFFCFFLFFFFLEIGAHMYQN